MYVLCQDASTPLRMASTKVSSKAKPKGVVLPMELSKLKEKTLALLLMQLIFVTDVVVAMKFGNKLLRERGEASAASRC